MCRSIRVLQSFLTCGGAPPPPPVPSRPTALGFACDDCPLSAAVSGAPPALARAAGACRLALLGRLPAQCGGQRDPTRARSGRRRFLLGFAWTTARSVRRSAGPPPRSLGPPALCARLCLRRLPAQCGGQRGPTRARSGRRRLLLGFACDDCPL